MTIKETALLAAITAMIVSQAAAGIQVGGAVIAAFSLFDVDYHCMSGHYYQEC